MGPEKQGDGYPESAGQDPAPADRVATASIDTLAEFVLRARRVEQHSLLKHKDFREFLHATLKVVLVDGQVGLISRNLPDEELLESAAARVRPILLQEETVNFHKVLKSIGYILHRAAGDTFLDGLEAIQRDWRRIDRWGASPLGYSVQTHSEEDGFSPWLADMQLGFSWLYGDVVHANRHGTEGAYDMGIQVRFAAAVPLVCTAMMLTVATLNLIQRITSAGVVNLPKHVWDDEVTANGGAMTYATEDWVDSTAVEGQTDLAS